MSTPQRVVVIGGGIAGLATAALLAADGHSVTLFEARDSLGGRAGSWEHNGFRFDTGPSWYLMPEVFDHFFRLLGTTAEEQLALVRLDPAYRVYTEGDPDEDTQFEKHWGMTGPILDNRGDSATLATYTDVQVACGAYGSRSC